MLITLFTDASFYREQGIGAWAAWAKRDGKSVTGEGLLRGVVRGSDQAEIMAIANGVNMAAKRLAQPGDTILVQADNETALRTLRHKSGPALHMPVLKVITDVCEEKSITLRLRHIKAHSGTHEPRLWCHDDCDQRARRLAKTEIKFREAAQRKFDYHR